MSASTTGKNQAIPVLNQVVIAAAHESAFGAKRTFQSRSAMSAFRGQSGHRSDLAECLLFTQSGHWLEMPRCLLLTQSGHGTARLTVSPLGRDADLL